MIGGELLLQECPMSDAASTNKLCAPFFNILVDTAVGRAMMVDCSSDQVVSKAASYLKKYKGFKFGHSPFRTNSEPIQLRPVICSVVHLSQQYREV